MRVLAIVALGLLALACGDDEPSSQSSKGGAGAGAAGGGGSSVGGSGGAGGAGGAGGVTSLTFIDDLNFDTGAQFGGEELGGISAIYYRASDNRVLALSDDRGNFGSPRFFELDIALTDTLTLTPTRVVSLQGPMGPYALGEVDPEGIAPLGDALIFSSEGDGLAERASLPRCASSIQTGRTSRRSRYRRTTTRRRAVP